MEPQKQKSLQQKLFEAQQSMATETPRSLPGKGEESYFDSFVGKVSSTIGLPIGFFQSRPEMRTWGESDMKDPSVQPRSESAPVDYGTGLPGYSKQSCTYFDNKFGHAKGSPEFVNLFTNLGVRDDKFNYPKVNTFPKCQVKYPSLPTDKLGTPTYDYRDLLGYRMDYQPYVNAVMTPQDPSRMYVSANWMVGYPYGVPAVEENENAAPPTIGIC